MQNSCDQHSERLVVWPTFILCFDENGFVRFEVRQNEGEDRRWASAGSDTVDGALVLPKISSGVKEVFQTGPGDSRLQFLIRLAVLCDNVTNERSREISQLILLF